MPAGDWHPETRIVPTLVNVQLTDDGRIHHVGIAYRVMSPSGRVLTESAHTWDIPDDHRQDLERVMAQLVADTVEHEGVAGAEFPEFPDVPEAQAVGEAG